MYFRTTWQTSGVRTLNVSLTWKEPHYRRLVASVTVHLCTTGGAVNLQLLRQLKALKSCCLPCLVINLRVTIPNISARHTCGAGVRDPAALPCASQTLCNKGTRIFSCSLLYSTGDRPPLQDAPDRITESFRLEKTIESNR